MTPQIWSRCPTIKATKRPSRTGRTRTCNQTVMSGRMSISFVDFSVFLFGFDRVCFGSFRLFLVRNWRGYPVSLSGTTSVSAWTFASGSGAVADRDAALGVTCYCSRPHTPASFPWAETRTIGTRKNTRKKSVGRRTSPRRSRIYPINQSATSWVHTVTSSTRRSMILLRKVHRDSRSCRDRKRGPLFGLTLEPARHTSRRP